MPDLRTEDLAVGFLDMSGFAALTEAHGDLTAATLAEDFTELTRALMSREDRLIKSIGDAVLFVSPTARGALKLIGRVIEATHRAARYPVLRGGIAYGPVLSRRGDVYGGTVNVAARLTALASPGQTVTTRAVAEAAAAAGIGVIPRGRTALRNISQPVESFAIALDSDCHCGQVDPVCRMRLTAEITATPTTSDNSYRFCSEECAQRFAAHDTTEMMRSVPR